MTQTKPVKTFKFGNGGVIFLFSPEHEVIEFAAINPEMGYVGKVKDGDFHPDIILYNTVFGINKPDDVDAMRSLGAHLNNSTKGFTATFNYPNCSLVFDFENYNPEGVELVLKEITDFLVAAKNKEEK